MVQARVGLRLPRGTPRLSPELGSEHGVLACFPWSERGEVQRRFSLTLAVCSRARPGRLGPVAARGGLNGLTGGVSVMSRSPVVHDSFICRIGEIISMHSSSRSLACSISVVSVMGSLVLITVVVLISDVVAAPGLARDVVAAVGGHLAALAGSAWFSRSTSRRSAKVCATCRLGPCHTPRGLGSPVGDRTPACEPTCGV